MKIAPRRQQIVMLESVAMTDIVLNMFIFFFISFSILYTFNPTRVQKMEVKLPKASNTSRIEKPDKIDVTLTSEGIMYIDQDIVSLRELKNRIRAAHEKNPDIAVMLRADKLVSFKNVVTILDLLTELGVSNLNIAAIKD